MSDVERQQAFNDEIRRIFSGGRINQIDWGADSDTVGWNAWSIKEQLQYAKDLASSMNQAADLMQKERNKALEDLRVAKLQRENSEAALGIFKTTMTEAIVQHNTERQESAKLISELQSRVKTQDEVIRVLNERS